MGAGIFWSTAVTGALVLFGVWLRDRRRDRRALPDTLAVAEQLAAAETTYRTELHAAPVVGVPYDTVRSDGSHDLYPHMSDAARDVCIGYLEAAFAQPDAERAQ